ncbi:hypothetical protein U1Q18_023228 [Sarracenia purpurea var. burkii]
MTESVMAVGYGRVQFPETKGKRLQGEVTDWNCKPSACWAGAAEERSTNKELGFGLLFGSSHHGPEQRIGLLFRSSLLPEVCKAY